MRKKTQPILSSTNDICAVPRSELLGTVLTYISKAFQEIIYRGEGSANRSPHSSHVKSQYYFTDAETLAFLTIYHHTGIESFPDLALKNVVNVN